MGNTLVSIIVCTFNRSAQLRQTLDAFMGVNVPAGLAAELIVVDNASTDNTTEVVRSTALPQFNLRYTYEPRKGQCFARNRGLDHANGHVILFTDDDVVPSPAWLDGMTEPILSGTAQCVAGRIELPSHLCKDWMDAFHRSQLGERIYNGSRSTPVMVGANMAFSRDVLSQVPSFDPELGPGQLGYGDDTLFSLQCAEAGFHIACGDERSTVFHHCDPGRTERSAYIERAINVGRASAYIAYHWQHEHVHRCLPKLMQAWLGLQYIRTRTLPSRYRQHVPICSAEFTQLSKVAYLRQWLRERQRIRKYPQRGSRKLDDNVDATAVTQCH
jgi:glycosyltransferase involved in cell wall biosynthesis